MTPPMPADQPPGAARVAGPYVPPCNQSVMQVTFDNPGAEAVAVDVTSVRVINATADRSIASEPRSRRTDFIRAGAACRDGRSSG